MLISTRSLLLALAATTCAASLAAQAKVSEDSEPNNLVSGRPTSLLCGDQASGTIDPPVGSVVDEDAYSFTLTSMMDVYGFTARGGATGFCSNTILELYAGDATTLLASNDNGGPGLYSAIGPVTLPAGTYFFNVKPFDASTTTPGTYTLDVICLPASTPDSPLCTGPLTPFSEGSEPNSSPATALPVSCCSTSSGTIGFSGDWDWYCLLVTEELIVTAETINCGGTLGDSQIWLWNSAGNNTLAKDFNSGSGDLARLEIRLQPSTYYVQVAGENGDTGTYCLDITCVRPGSAPFGDPAFAVIGGGCQGSNGRTPTIVPRLGELPRLGSLFCVDAIDMPDPDIASFALIGFNDNAFDLTAVGAPGCVLLTDNPTVIPVTSVSGNANLDLSVPKNPANVGLEFRVQFAAFDPPANALGLVLSNIAIGTIGI